MEIKAIDTYIWEIPATGAMQVPARFFAEPTMIEELKKDKALWQLTNVATLQGIQMAALGMPDIHEGYGFPIGGIAAMDVEQGIISPGGIGYDINCGVRLLKTNLYYDQIKNKIPELAKALFRWVPSGLKKGQGLKLKAKELEAVLRHGAQALIPMGYATEEDIHFTESFGKLSWANPNCVSKRAKERGSQQLGTIGSGNHFVEIDRVQKIEDETAATIYGLHPNQIVVLIHTGSRGLGHQVATDYIYQMLWKMEDYGIEVPDKQLACAPFSSVEGQNYFAAMAAAANFAWANRQMVTYEVRKAFEEVLGKRKVKIQVCYDVAHNIAKLETHTINGMKKEVIVHRKGATRAFPAHHPEVIPEYRDVGQPVLIPGSMGTASYVLAGAQQSMSLAFGSTCHGAGRKLSRKQAKKQVDGKALIQELRKKGIWTQAGSYKGVAEEAPIAYKNVHSVVEVVHQVGLARKVAVLKPLAVIKG